MPVPQALNATSDQLTAAKICG